MRATEAALDEFIELYKQAFSITRVYGPNVLPNVDRADAWSLKSCPFGGHLLYSGCPQPILNLPMTQLTLMAEAKDVFTVRIPSLEIRPVVHTVGQVRHV